MFILRTAFWLSLVVLVMPTDRVQQAKLYTAASDALHQAATFCDRQQALCEQGAGYWSVFKTKLEFGARMTIDLASERLFGGDTRAEQPASKPSRDTLAPADLVPEWRAKPARTGA